MNHTDNLRVEFNLVIDKRYINDNPQNIIHKPIVVNNVPVGCIIDARLDESGLYYSCSGAILDRFISIDLAYGNSSEIHFDSIRIL